MQLLAEGSSAMTSKLSEWRVVQDLAEFVSWRITRRVIRTLQGLSDGLQSGDDSGLKSAWEEICVQVQGEQSFHWDAYDQTVRQRVSAEVNQLKPHERDAVWLQTSAGLSWDSEDEGTREASPVDVDEIVEYLTSDFVYSAAGDWNNKRIRKYVTTTQGEAVKAPERPVPQSRKHKERKPLPPHAGGSNKEILFD
jgi:hypothetical protein